MRPSFNSSTFEKFASRRFAADGLIFRQFDIRDIPAVQAMVARVKSRTCDFTIGGIFMWDDYFAYTRAIYADTLFIRGLCENDPSRHAFSLPVGDLSLPSAINRLRHYCAAHSMPLQLSAVPEEYLPELEALGAINIEEIPDWADYLYDLESLSTLAGKKMSKKRNHVNRFAADNPDAVFEPLTRSHLEPALEFIHRLEADPDKSAAAQYELRENEHVLRHLADYPFEGAVLTTPAHGIVGLTIGEAMGDTLHVHIEKMDHEVAGAGETLCHRFARMMLERHPELKYENRQEDTGDAGLRRAKLSYQPTALLRKYNLEIPL